MWYFLKWYLIVCIVLFFIGWLSDAIINLFTGYDDEYDEMEEDDYVDR
jgi:hypothetical protein